MSRWTAPASRSAPARPKAGQGKGEDGKAGTREVKLARLFTVSRLDDDGRPGDGPRLLQPTWPPSTARTPSPGWWRPSTCAAAASTSARSSPSATAPPGSGPWPRRLYPHATHITDIYHAREHLTTSPATWPSSPPTRPGGSHDRSAELDAGNIEAIIAAARAVPARRHQGRASWTRSSATSSATPTGCATSTSATSACSPARAPSKAGMQSDRRPARQAVRHALDHRRRRQHHRPALPARQRPMGRALASRAPSPAGLRAAI